MSDKGRFQRTEFEVTLEDLKHGAAKYVDAYTKVLEKMKGGNIAELGIEMVFMGYAMGVVAGKCSDVGVEGFSLVLNGIKISLHGEDRKEAMQFAVWDKDGRLHTSEEGYRMKKGGES